ncbi:MAG: hypothetical protein MJ162_04315 [Treponema sp.]|nr:hypothetical protein [Treponema sp.]
MKKSVKAGVFVLLILCFTNNLFAAIFGKSKEKKSFEGPLGRILEKQLIDTFDMGFLEGDETYLTTFSMETNPRMEQQRTENKFIQEGERIIELRTTYYGDTGNYEQNAEPALIEIYSGARCIQKIENIETYYKKPAVYDVNYDGYDDIVVLSSVGSGGSWYSVYLWDKDNRIFVLQEDTLVNPRFSQEEDVIYQRYRVGASEVIYVFTAFNELNREDVLEVDRQISADKIHFDIVIRKNNHETKMEFDLPADFENLTDKDQQTLLDKWKGIASDMKTALKLQ